MSATSNLPRITLRDRLPVLAGFCSCYSSTTASVNSSFQKKCDSRFKESSSLMGSLAAAFWAQLMSMAGSVGVNSFIASARQKGAMNSVDYLTKPMEVFKEMYQILKPGGLAIISLSDRCFWTKAISIWTSTGDADRVMIVGSYFHYSGGFEPPQAAAISPNPRCSDPM